MSKLHSIDLGRPIPIFPLPNCVLLPRAVLPLHIFEPRYREMLGDCLVTTPHIAMAVLEPGYEEKYYTHVAAIRSVVCVGEIMRHEKLEDGRYNILLQGLVRANVVSEDREKDYRRGILKPVVCCGQPSACEAPALRARILSALAEPRMRNVAQKCGWTRVAEAEEIPISDVVDYLASGVCCNAESSLRFLEEPDLQRRLLMLLDQFRGFAARQESAADACGGRPYPRRSGCN